MATPVTLIRGPLLKDRPQGSRQRARVLHALRTEKNVVTLGHDANPTRMSSALFVQAGREVARPYGGSIELEEVDAKMAALQVVLNPSRFEVMVTVGPLGDILANVAAGLIGGPELVPILAGAMMLRHIGAARASEHIETAVRSLINERDPSHLPPRLGGHASTAAFGEHVANRVRAPRLETDAAR